MAGTLTKADIISGIQTENDYSLNKSDDIVETLLEIIKRTLESGEDVLDNIYHPHLKEKNCIFNRKVNHKHFLFNSNIWLQNIDNYIFPFKHIALVYLA